ncbi:MAG: alpha/beta hydrolase, partial [Bacteroidetes bacterium]|nr:alpha/beta hydrolase [Bacteroidota bacterium]
MYKVIGLITVLQCTWVMVYSQPASMVKYKDPLYTVTTTFNISYYTNNNSSVKDKYYLFDLFQPKEDTSSFKPLIIWMHGGGFKYGNKKSGGIPLWCHEFAKRGYICASINYRLSKKKPLRRFTDLVDGCLDATEDLQKAITYFKQNGIRYKIDTTKIIVAGNSAGAITGLQAVYSSPYEMMKLINQPDYDTLRKTHNPSGICAIINFWGALFDSTWLKNERIPIVSIHGEKDKIVNFDHKGPINGSLVIYR